MPRCCPGRKGRGNRRMTHQGGHCVMCCGPAIRKDDLAKHVDKLKKSGANARLRIVAPRENEGDSKASHFDSASGNSSEGGRHAFRTALLSLRQ
jgi:hypothetical protein